MSFGQGGPEWGPGGSSTPDWAALAEEAEHSRSRSKRRLILGGGALAAVAVAVIVAVTLLGGGNSGNQADDKNLPSEKDLGSAQPEPTFEDSPPPPPPPKDFIADAKRDRAPISTGTLFPGDRARIDGRTYKKAATGGKKKCADAAHAGLKSLLTKNDCRALYRATYTRGELAVTVGIAVFEDTATAEKVKAGYKPNILPLPGEGVPDFCRTVECRTTVNSAGRYAIFTISGRTNGEASDASDTAAEQAGRDGSSYAYSRIMDRGRKQAEEYAATATPG